ncbi:PEP-CTERM sorting domain-containing protein [Candidatus Nitrosacidococcus tergens]|uniref:Putative Secreted protein containing PEP-CTERM bacterial domain protein n=1 Tax=Candidatus Nitrosacidococcus tergens TaxID=553981 RepID=A0A7G1QAD5_9GAMM|nr:PEP-CTERM sorting domain-containing protein [Candidatus Nitrosacidococcus tergens]CAB1276402.1 putative Secreted protein containing PEP-CTERM bacterial domain protein [Candidatus Nitrosacidococcus tergens]
MMLSSIKKCLLSLLFGCNIVTAQASIMFNAIYDDVINNTGVGFDDPTIVGPNDLTLGQERQNTLQAVFNYLNTVIDETGTFNLEVNSSLLPDNPNSSNIVAPQFPLVYNGLSIESSPDDILAQGGSYYAIQNGFNSGLTFEDITTGSTLYPGVPDADIQFNFSQNWNSGLGQPDSDQYDLFTVALHEITHDLGFDSFISETGASIFAQSNGINAYTTYDSYLVLGDGTPLVDSAGNFLGTQSDLIDNDIYFSGKYANAANGGMPVQVYDPSTWAQGSSLVHLNDPSDLMYYLINPGMEKRTFSNVDLGILQDLGYTLYSTNNGGDGGQTPPNNGNGGEPSPPSVPEPSSLALFLLGSIFIYSRRNLYFLT